MPVPYASNVGQLYVPTLELSGNLMIGFSRNIKDYNVNRYVKLVPVKKDRGAFLYFNPQDNARLPGYNSSAPTRDGNKWPSGTASQRGFGNAARFYQGNFVTQRYQFAVTLDGKSVDLANFPVQKINTEILAQQAMTRRAISVCNNLFNSSNYPSSQVAATASGVSDVGGNLYAGTTASPYIKKMVDYALYTIQKATMGSIRMPEVSMLMNVRTAMKLSQTREIREYVMQQAGAGDLIEGKGELYNTSTYGLPKKLYTVNVLVEDLFYDAANKSNDATITAADTGSPVVADNTLLFLVRSQDLEGVEGGMDRSTAAMFLYEDMTVESKYDPWDRLLDLRVVDDYDVQTTSPVSAFLVSDVSS